MLPLDRVLPGMGPGLEGRTWVRRSQGVLGQVMRSLDEAE